MTVRSNEIRTITIEGVAFTPSNAGTKVPGNKVASLNKNFFFKHYLNIGSFIIVEEKAPAQIKAESSTKDK